MSIIFNNKFDLSKYLGQGQMLVSSHELKVRSTVFINHSSSATRIDINLTQVGSYVGCVARDLIAVVTNEHMSVYGRPNLMMAHERNEAIHRLGFIDAKPQVLTLPVSQHSKSEVHFVVSFKWDGMYKLSVLIQTVGTLP